MAIKVKTPTQSSETAISPEWRVKIDYLSFTTGDYHVSREPTSYTPHAYAVCISEGLPPEIFGALSRKGVDLPTLSSGRSGYTQSSRLSIGASFFTGHATAKPLLELGGAACDALQAAGLLLPLVQRHCEGLTRIDLAGDITCAVSPSEFLSSGFSPLYRSDGRDKSATGHTEYIGSPKSDRHARVYRYAPPHPRADALRVEVVLRRELAKSAGMEICSRSVADVWRMASKRFSFKHPLWRQPETSTLPRLTLRSEPTSASRLFWLTKQIKPAVLKAHTEGLINLAAWLAEI